MILGVYNQFVSTFSMGLRESLNLADSNQKWWKNTKSPQTEKAKYQVKGELGKGISNIGKAVKRNKTVESGLKVQTFSINY